jgi:hypothetical protein
MLTEPQSRQLAAGIVAALHDHQCKVDHILVRANGSGITCQINVNGLVVECHVPPGHFSYDRVALEIMAAMGRSVMES